LLLDEEKKNKNVLFHIYKVSKIRIQKIKFTLKIKISIIKCSTSRIFI